MKKFFKDIKTYFKNHKWYKLLCFYLVTSIPTFLFLWCNSDYCLELMKQLPPETYSIGGYHVSQLWHFALFTSMYQFFFFLIPYWLIKACSKWLDKDDVHYE